MMPEWTPRPWQIAKNKWNAKAHEPWTDAIKIEGDIEANWVVPPLVCVTYRGDGQDANAHLIAAAPDLFEALEFIFEHIADKERGPRDLYPAFGLDASRAIEGARAALAKARGEP